MPRPRAIVLYAVRLLAGAALLVGPAPSAARVLLTVDEALELAFPEAEIERRTVFLSEQQIARATKLAGQPPSSAVVHPYIARRKGAVVGTAYFDAHVVRTLNETVMVTVDSEGRIGRVEVLSFEEPPDYLPRDAWYEQFAGRRLDAELELRRAVRPVAGATLTARATSDAARRVLALHEVIADARAPAPTEAKSAAGVPPPP